MKASFRYKLFFFFAFAFLAYFLVFLPVLWRELGFSLRELAAGSMMGTLAAIVSAPSALSLAHHKFSARRMLLPLMAVGFLSFSSHLFVLDNYTLIFFWLITAFSGRAIYSLVEAQGIRDSESSSHEFNFEEIRIWGSIGFIVSTLLTGSLMESLSLKELACLGMFYLALNYLAAFICRPLLKEKPGFSSYEDKTSANFENLPLETFKVNDSKVKDNKSLKEKTAAKNILIPISALYLINFLIWASHAPLYVYLSVYLKELGWSGAMISAAWNIGVVAEIALIAVFPKIQKHISLENLLRMTICFTALRWLIMAYNESVISIMLAQVLHLFSFGVCYLASIKLVHRILPPEFKDRGQGYLASFGTGLGSFTGRALAMYFAGSGQVGGVVFQNMFIGAGVIAALAFPVSFFLGEKDSSEIYN